MAIRSIVFYLLFVFLIIIFRPNSRIFDFIIDSNKKKLTSFLVVASTILIVILPMSLSPYWNGEIAEHRNQYELMADQIIKGEVKFDYEVDEKLKQLVNPYDPAEREEYDIDYHWDHSYYNGSYYMYFGIVPVLLLFIPFKLITGLSLTTYHATQFFCTFYLLGLYRVLRTLENKIKYECNSIVFFLLFVSISLISTWYCSSTPALYCTAISSAMCFEIWSYFFYLNANDNNQICYEYLMFGSLLGALAFGCRPTIALANVIVISIYGNIIKNRHFSVNKLILSLLPFLFVGIGLMYYNYIRFDSVFEFGQSYQLTSADQTSYNNLINSINPTLVLKTFFYYLFNISNHDIGILLIYPLFFFSLLSSVVYRKTIIRVMKETNLMYFFITSVISILIILVFIILYSPTTNLRYKSDFAWILSIDVFLILCSIIKSVNNKVFLSFVSYFSLLTMIVCVVLFLYPRDYNWASIYFNNPVNEYIKLLSFGLIY